MKKVKHFLSLSFLFLHTFVQAQVPLPHPDVSQDSRIFAALSGPTQIGKAYGVEGLSYAEHKVLHAGLGAITGAILDSKNPGNGAFSGALGAVTSEMLAEAISGNPKEMATRVLGEVAERAALEGRKFSQKEYESALKEAAEVAKNFGQLGAASVALFSRQDVGTAIHTAQTATENNLIPGLIAGGLIIWSAYDLWETYANEGPEAALKQAGTEVVVAVVGGTAIKRGFKIAGKIYPIAEAAWAAHVAENPIMAKIGEVITGAVEKGKNWVGRGAGKAVELKKPTLNLELSFKKGMNQRDFDRKIAVLQKAAQDGRLVAKVPHGVSAKERRIATQSYRRDLQKRIKSFYKDNQGSKIKSLEKLKKSDIDHIIDLQLSGGNTRINLKSLDSYTNQELGRQISRQLKRQNNFIVKNIKHIK